MKIAMVSESEFSVQGHGVHTAYIELVNAFKKRSDVELVVNTFGSADIRHIHTVGPYSLAHLLFGHGKKVVSAHIIPESLVGSLIGAQYWLPLARWYLRWFYNRADIVLAVSDETKMGLKSLGVKRPIEVFYNVIDTARYHRTVEQKAAARHKLSIATDAWVVTSNGQVQPRKRVDTFVRLAQELPDMTFIWIGGIPFKKAAADYDLMKKTMDNAPDNARFTGVVSIDEVRDYFQASDVFISTSDQETFGIAIVEGASTGLPVVLRDIHDYDNTFREDALMCSEEEFVSCLQQLRTDKKLYDQYVAHSHDLAVRYDSVHGAERLIEIYRNLVR